MRVSGSITLIIAHIIKKRLILPKFFSFIKMLQNLNKRETAMTSLVPFDPQGAMGPAFSLIFNHEKLTPANVSDIVTLLEVNFERLAHRKPEGSEDLISMIGLIKSSPIDQKMKRVAMLSQRFFVNMQNKNLPFDCHAKMVNVIVPEVLKEASKHFNNIDCNDADLKEWTANFLQCWYSEEKIRNFVVVDAAFMEERKRIGTDLYKAVMTKDDFDRIGLVCQKVVEELCASDNKTLTLNVVADYLKLFARAPDPMAASKDILGSLPAMKDKKTFVEPK